MKKTLPLSLLLFTLAFSACKKDNSIKHNDLVGQYSLTAYTGYGESDNLLLEVNSNSKPCMRNLKFTLREDNTATSSYLSNDVCNLSDPSASVKWSLSPRETQYFIWSFSNNQIQIQETGASSTHTYSITRKNGKIELTEDYQGPFKYKQTFTKD
ncbi:hypothetical protein D0C36_21825 [Mucilaginibacter conchicola]|uniref:Lipocalin-like domain-containing protein n=1 Tax=Mucilaginibacter conchicola TaxID=2303333 RepID=A0A372NQA3_9SPHI|nr:lipocalin family protein [Mucilaginibacter conchicola]RFZ90433.1 hypothetical protein D0C36_21825 [Mucilaginibacter conchicola]